MSIPYVTLSQWAAYPGPARSAAAYAKVRAALEVGLRLNEIDVELYLQGSYRNHVNTKSDSDVDLVVELISICEFDTQLLSPWDAQRFWSNLNYSDYTYLQFRGDVLGSLTTAFGDAVVEHKKAIEVKGNWLRMKVDVLPAQRYRRVHAYDGINFASHDGISFWADGRQVVNWPKQHFDNGVAKNQNTNEHFKPAVRMMKNARRVTIDQGLLRDGTAPSYFLQGLVWNIPDECFVADLSATYVNLVDWLYRNRITHRWFKCQNGIDDLFGYSPEQWTIESAIETGDALAALWNRWQ